MTMRRCVGVVSFFATVLCFVGCRSDFRGDGDDGQESGTGTNGDGDSESTDEGSGEGSSTDGESTGETGDAICEAATHTCIPEPTEGWIGPLAIFSGDADALPPGCEGGYPDVEHQLNGGLEVGNAECGCECGPTTGVDCKAVTMDYYGNNACSGTALSTNVGGLLEPNQCEIIGDTPFTGTWVEVSDGGVDAPGECQPMPSETIPEPDWASLMIGCGGATLTGGCGTGEICAPRAPDQFMSVCIASPGEVACPEGDYSERTVWFSDYEDDRACVGCTCESPTGICEGVLELRNGGCNSQLIEAVPAGSCGNNPINNTYLAVEYKPSAGGCDASTPELSGEAAGTGAVTYCCLE